MSGNCFHLAVKYFQKDICNILVHLYGFGIWFIYNFCFILNKKKIWFANNIIDPRQSCSLGCTPLHWAMSTTHTKLIKRVY